MGMPNDEFPVLAETFEALSRNPLARL